MRRLQIALVAASLGSVLPPAVASAAEVLPVEITFASGASFKGRVTFLDDYSRVIAVTGTLRGYSSASTVYTPGATDSINWVWNGGADNVPGRWRYGTYLVDGTNAGNYTNRIRLTYDFQSAPNLSFIANGANRTTVNGTDAFASGIIGGVPEPASWLLFILGFGAVGAALRDQRRRRSLVSEFGRKGRDPSCI